MLRWTEEQYDEFLKSRTKESRNFQKPQRVIVGGYQSNWSGTVPVGGKRYHWRSYWEYCYACFLEWQVKTGSIIDWTYEPKRFDFRDKYKRGPFSYLPDFKVQLAPHIHQWHEVKGYLTSSGKSKIKRFEKHFPEEGAIVMIAKDWFKNASQYRAIVPGWLTLEQMQAKYPRKKKA